MQLFVERSRTEEAVAKLVHQIDCGYECSQSGWVMIYFDTRPDAAPDGQWTRFIDQRRMEREHWRKASSAHMRGPICIVDHYGAERLIPEGRENEMREAIGMMLKSVLLRARDEKLFLPLPFAPTCTLGVEDFDGAFAWPIYEERDGNALVMQPPRQGS